MDFDGVNDAIDVTAGGSVSCLNGVAGATMFGWHRFDTNVGDPTFSWAVSGAPSITSRMTLERDAVGATEVAARAPDGGGFPSITDPAAPPAVGTHTHIAVTVNVAADLGAIYRDGALALSAAMAFAGAAFDATDSGAAALMAQDTAAGSFVDGSLEDARIYQRVLSANEISTINACRGHDGIWAGIHHRWSLSHQPPGTVAAGAGTIIDRAIQKLDVNPIPLAGGPVYEQTRLSYRRRYL